MLSSSKSVRNGDQLFKVVETISCHAKIWYFLAKQILRVMWNTPLLQDFQNQTANEN